MPSKPLQASPLSKSRVLRKKRTPATSTKKDVSYVASGTKSSQIVAFAGTDSDTVTTAEVTKEVTVQNVGNFPVLAMIGYQGYSDEDTQGQTIFLHTLLKPN